MMFYLQKKGSNNVWYPLYSCPDRELLEHIRAQIKQTDTEYRIISDAKEEDVENPEIERVMRTGYPRPEPECPRCPVCGEECDTVYKDIHREVVGCENCISTADAWEEEENGH